MFPHLVQLFTLDVSLKLVELYSREEGVVHRWQCTFSLIRQKRISLYILCIPSFSVPFEFRGSLLPHVSKTSVEAVQIQSDPRGEIGDSVSFAASRGPKNLGSLDSTHGFLTLFPSSPFLSLYHLFDMSTPPGEDRTGVRRYLEDYASGNRESEFQITQGLVKALQVALPKVPKHIPSDISAFQCRILNSLTSAEWDELRSTKFDGVHTLKLIRDTLGKLLYYIEHENWGAFVSTNYFLPSEPTRAHAFSR